MIDPFGRSLTYLRISVTDRCDLRCTYCMTDGMSFLPRTEVLSLEELERIAVMFIDLGVHKIRLSGGEPFARRDLMVLVARLGQRLGGGLRELTLTTNGTRLARHAEDLWAAGVRRVNVSLDTLNPERFAALTGRGRLETVLDGIKAARAAGLAVKINAVAIDAAILDEIDDLLIWCGENAVDMTLIEPMPMGGERPHLPLAVLRERILQRWTLTDTPDSTGGPARYALVGETGRRLGFITPMSSCFCDTCNRLRLSCSGTLYPCLGQNHAIDLKTPLRKPDSDHALRAAIEAAVAAKPKGHEFGSAAAIPRPMCATGG